MFSLACDVLKKFDAFLHLPRLGDEGSLRRFLLTVTEAAETIAAETASPADDAAVAIAQSLLADDAAWGELYELARNRHLSGKELPLAAADLGEKILAALPEGALEAEAAKVATAIVTLCEHLHG